MFNVEKESDTEFLESSLLTHVHMYLLVAARMRPRYSGPWLGAYLSHLVLRTYGVRGHVLE